MQMGKTSLVRALMSPSSKCDVIDKDDRTVGIDRHEMQLRATVIDRLAPSTADVIPVSASASSSARSLPPRPGKSGKKSFMRVSSTHVSSGEERAASTPG